MSYRDFLHSKATFVADSGFDIGDRFMFDGLFDFQRDIVRWACRMGRCAVFAGTGLGKSAMQLEWANQVAQHTGSPVLILAPLAVAEQTVGEASKFGLDAELADSHASVRGGQPGVYVTNYQKIHRFDVGEFSGVVLDESSILKAVDGKTRTRLIRSFRDTPFRLCCTATPAPNDHTEIGNHSEFLGVMTRPEMLSKFFVHDGGSTQDWRLKGHARDVFWQWVGAWSVVIQHPGDFGYESGKLFDLPPLNQQTIVVGEDRARPGMLFDSGEGMGLQERRQCRRQSMDDRVAKIAEMANASDEPWLIWCDLNDESSSLVSAIHDAVEVSGSMSDDAKGEAMTAFSNGDIRVLVTKPKIAGFGMNWQHCRNVAFCGISDSFEAFYQSIRRCWRFGQTREVNVYVVVGFAERVVSDNVQRKAERAAEMVSALSGKLANTIAGNIKSNRMLGVEDMENRTVRGDGWRVTHGDCVEVVGSLPDESIGYSIFSPPFASLYTYSDSARDMGNCDSHDQFYEHFRFLVRELLRVTKPGRNLSFHCMNLPTSKARDGFIGISDFRGELIRMFVEQGWIYHSEVCIWKDPVTAMQRTKALGLLHKQLKKDSCMSRQGIADYLVTMRKPGDNPDPVTNTNQTFPVREWQEYASPVWMDINPSDTLQGRSAREDQDERHICLAEGSLVLTRDSGYVPIESVQVGDMVLTHKARWRPVTAKACNGTAEVVRITAQGVARLICTPDHRLWTRVATIPYQARKSAMETEPSWVDADKTLGSYLNLPSPPVDGRGSDLSSHEWWIVGRWLGDRHRGGRRHSGVRGGVGQFIISCSHDEAPGLIDRLGDHAGHASVRTATQIAIVNLRKEVRDVLDRCGSGAANKSLPGEALTLDRDKSAALLDGYISADGCFVERYNRVCASSISRSLLLGLAVVAQRANGVVASVYAGRAERRGLIQGREVNMSQDWIFAFRASQGRRMSGWIDGYGAWKKVRRIEDAGKAVVWDLQVEEDQSFVAEGAVVHNCPLQLEVIRRALRLWSRPGDVVLSPFTGIGSEGYEAVKAGREFVGVELKESYFKQACANLETAVLEGKQSTLFDAIDNEKEKTA